MPFRALVTAVAVTVIAGHASTARADNQWDEERRNAPTEGQGDLSVWTERRLAIDGHMGFGTPYGLTGVSLELTPIPWWTFGGGLGVSFGGPQLAMSTRVRYPFGHAALAFGVGVSRGGYKTVESWIDASWTKEWAHAYWLNIEASVEHRWRTGLELRIYMGVGSLLNPGSGECHPNLRGYDCDGSGEPLGFLFSQNGVPYVGVAVGHAFAL